MTMEMLYSKIHRATVTDANLNYVGSITIDEELKSEGLSRELVNRVQNLRKDTGLEVTDRITLLINANDDLKHRLEGNLDYIRTQTLASDVEWTNHAEAVEIELDENNLVQVHVVKQ